ncbi:MAG: hypothetical protein AAB152_02210 [Candidatus Coatesbacteria bacterium]
MRTILVLAMVMISTAAPAATTAPSGRADRPFTDTFDMSATDFLSSGANRFFILEPGYVLEFAGTEDGKPLKLVITVLADTKVVDGVTTRVVEEREWSKGKLSEVSRNYYAFDRRTSSVWYFGEDVDEYKDGKVASHGGSWLSGVNGARYGLFMPGLPLLGSRFYQEVAPGAAMDRARIVSLSDTLTAPAGTFTGCLRMEETTPLEPGTKSEKVYAPGVGLIKDGDLLLVKSGKR